MDLERLLSISTLPCVDVDDGALRRTDISTGSGSSSAEAPLPNQFRVGVKIRSATFGEDSSGSRVIAVFLNNGVLILQTCRAGEDTASLASGDEAFTMRTFSWFASREKAINHMAFSPSAKMLAALCRDGSVFIIPAAKLLAQHPSRLFQPEFTQLGLPSMASLVFRRAAASSKGGPKDPKWAAVDAVKLTLPPFKALGGDDISGKTVPTNLMWVSATEIAFLLPGGVANVVSAMSSTLTWYGPTSDVLAGTWWETMGDQKSSSRSRRSSSAAPSDLTTLPDEEDVDGVTDGAHLAVSAPASTELSASSAKLTPESLHAFAVWTDHAVFQCIPSLNGPASACLQYCYDQLLHPVFPRPDLALRAAAVALGLPASSLASETLITFPESFVDLSVIDGISMVPSPQQPLIADLMVQCYCIARACFAANPTAFSTSSACSADRVSATGTSSRSSDKRFKPRRAAFGNIAGVDFHRFLLTNEAYNSDRAVSWLLSLDCVFECLLVGHARSSLQTVLGQLFQQYGPKALGSQSLEFLTSRGYAEMVLTSRGGLYARTMYPKTFALLLCSSQSQLVAQSLELSSILHLLDLPTLQLVVASLHPDVATGVPPERHTQSSAECFIQAFLSLLSLQPIPSPLVPESTPAALKSRQSSVTSDDDSSLVSPVRRAGGIALDRGRTLSYERFNEEDFLGCLRLLHKTYASPTVLGQCLEFKFYAGAALVSELDGDIHTSFHCRLIDCVESPKLTSKLDYDRLRECSTCVIETVSAAWRLKGSDSFITSIVCEAIRFWHQRGLSSSALAECLLICLRRYGLPVAKGVLGDLDGISLLPSIDSHGPFGQLNDVLIAHTKQCVSELKFPITLTREALEALCRANLPRLDEDHTEILASLHAKLAATSAFNNAPIVIPSSSILLQRSARPAFVFSCSHHYSQTEFIDSVLPHYKQSLRKLMDKLPQTVLQCDMLFDSLLKASETPPIAPSGCPVCVLAAIRSVVSPPQDSSNAAAKTADTLLAPVSLPSVASSGGDGRAVISTVRTVGEPAMQTRKSVAK